MTVVLGEIDVARGEPILIWPVLTRSALGLVPTPPANGGHPIPVADANSVTYPVAGDIFSIFNCVPKSSWGTLRVGKGTLTI